MKTRRTHGTHSQGHVQNHAANCSQVFPSGSRSPGSCHKGSHWCYYQALFSKEDTWFLPPEPSRENYIQLRGAQIKRNNLTQQRAYKLAIKYKMINLESIYASYIILTDQLILRSLCVCTYILMHVTKMNGNSAYVQFAWAWKSAHSHSSPGVLKDFSLCWNPAKVELKEYTESEPITREPEWD